MTTQMPFCDFIRAQTSSRLVSLFGTVDMKRDAKTWKAMAAWAERKADENAASDKPWALRNVRLYQNKASEFWREHYKAAHAEELEMSIAFQEAGEDSYDRDGYGTGSDGW